ncbi:hypothetical protein LCGC14_2976260, partial [marine sediment metagenome]
VCINFERYLTEYNKDKLLKHKLKLQKKILRRFKIFISNNVINHYEKELINRMFEEELDDKWDELKVHSILLNEFQGSLEDFYNQKKNEIKNSL